MAQNPASQTLIHARNTERSAGLYAINKVCGSGFKSVVLTANSIMIGYNKIVMQENVTVWQLY